MAQSRITDYDGENVTYWYQDHESGKIHHVAEHAHDFMERSCSFTYRKKASTCFATMGSMPNTLKNTYKESINRLLINTQVTKYTESTGNGSGVSSLPLDMI